MNLITHNLKNDSFDFALNALSQKYLPNLHANYLFFLFENKITQQRLVFNTNAQWYEYFIEKNLIQHCPLYAATQYLSAQSKQGTSHFLWNQIISYDKNQRQVAGLRHEHGIANGVSFSHHTKEHQVILGLGTHPKDYELETKYKLVLPHLITLFTEASYFCLQL